MPFHDTFGRRQSRKSLILILLGGLNLVLLLSLLFYQGVLPTAWAQAGRAGGGYLCVTAKPSGQAYDVLYLLDPSASKLHVFYPAAPPSKQLLRGEPRDLAKDFGR